MDPTDGLSRAIETTCGAQQRLPEWVRALSVENMLTSWRDFLGTL
jgi:hypothetical protein